RLFGPLQLACLVGTRHNARVIRAGSIVKSLLVLAALGSSSAYARRMDEVTLTQMPAGYIVAPFENHSPVKNLDWQPPAIAVTIAEKLEGHSSLRPAYGPAILDGFDYAFDAEKVARRAQQAGARWVFAGGFARPNWKAQVTIRLYTVVEPSNEVPNPTLRLVAGSSSIGEREQLMKLVDENLVGVLSKANLPVDAEAMAQIKRRPTKDLYAFTLYGRALNYCFGLGGARDLTKAVTFLKKVNLIDPKM